MSELDVPSARQHIQRWLASLRFPQSDEERQLKTAAIKMNEVDENKGMHVFLPLHKPQKSEVLIQALSI